MDMGRESHFSSSDAPIDLVTMSCRDCGPGLVRLDSITFRINVDSGIAAMAFRCSTCSRRDSRRISQVSVDKLLGAGVEPEYWRFPDEMRDVARRRDPQRAVVSMQDVGQAATDLIDEVSAFLAEAGPTRDH